MRTRKLIEKSVSFLVALALLLNIGQVDIAAAVSFSDTNNHWAIKEINKGVSLGLVKGYDDGTFKPNQPVTRAEFSKMLNIALGVANITSISFNDVRSNDWFYDEAKKAVAAGYITGYTDNTFKPNNKITRQEAANMISKVLPEYSSTISLSGLSDSGNIASWARDGVTAVFARGYMKGDDKNLYHPEGPLTRAEACAILVRFTEGESIISSNSTISSKGTSVRNKIYTNNLTIDKAVGDGDITLDKIIVLGTLTVSGGGEDTVEISDSKIKNMSVAKTTGDIRVLLTGDSVVEDAIIRYGTIIEQKSLTGEGFKKLRLNGSSLTSQNTVLKGNFTNVTLEDQALLELSSGKITTLIVNSGASSSTITLASGTTISTATVNAKAEFAGTGKITTMNANANGITYETKPSTITKGSGVTTPPVLSEDTDGPTLSSITPKADATGIAADTKITLVFKEAIYLEGGDKIANADIEDIIEVREDTTTGTKIDYSATISTDKKTITITPTDDLDINTYYYVIVLDESIEDIDENVNDKITSKFKTGSQDISAPKPTFSPANNATNVAVNSKITITFNEAIKLDGGGTVTNSNISTFVELRATSATGTRKTYTATINSTKKVIEITPSADLSVGENYYIIILSGEIEDAAGNSVSKTTSTFRTGLPVAATPTITTDPTSVADVANNGTVTVTIASTTSGGTIYYTLDGSIPTASSNAYTGAFYVTNNLGAGQTITVKAITVKSGMTNSTTASKPITFRSNQVATPTITSPTTVTNQSVAVTLSSSTSGATIYYTTNNTTPSISSNEYSGAFIVETSNPDGEVFVIKAIAVKDGMVNSNVASKTITFIANTVETPSITTSPTNVSGLENDASVTVTITSDTSGADIYYTTDGSTPTESSTAYSGPFSVNAPDPAGGSVVIKAIAIKTGMVDSDIDSKTITFQAVVVGP